MWKNVERVWKNSTLPYRGILNLIFLISQSFIIVIQVYDMHNTAIFEPVFIYKMSHYAIVAVGVDAYVVGMQVAKVHNLFKHPMGRWQAHYTMYHVVGEGVVNPCLSLIHI